jgi:hypothetical protein
MKIETEYKNLESELEKIEDKDEVIEIKITNPEKIILSSTEKRPSKFRIALANLNYSKSKIKIDLSPTDLTKAKVVKNNIDTAFINVTNLYKVGPLPKNIKSMVNTFSGCVKLEYIDTSNFDTVKDISAMCIYCKNLSSLDFSHFSGVKTADKAFWGTNLELADMSKMTSLKSASDMFLKCTSLKKISFPSGTIEDADSMCQFCDTLESVDTKGLSSCITLNHAFENTAIKTIDVSNLKKATSAKNIFNKGVKLENNNIPPAIFTDIMELLSDSMENVELMI